MASVEELVGAGGPLHEALAAGLADISQQQTVPFLTYSKAVLPLDGYVFWLRASSFEQTGMLHWMTEREVAEDETATRNTVVFTTTEEIVQLNQTNTQILVVGLIETRAYAFGRIGWFSPQSGVWHYQGEALHPATATQLIDDPAQLNLSDVIVSNSLPAWLTLQTYLPVWITWPGQRNPQIPLYPSFMLPDNIEPPFGSVHIEPTTTRALQSAPQHGRYTWSQWQSAQESVRVTLYGCDNNAARDFLDLVLDYSYQYGVIGMMNMPIVRDEKRPWAEGMTLAQKKTLEFEVSYTQTRISTIARQLILSAQATVQTTDLVIGEAAINLVGA